MDGSFQPTDESTVPFVRDERANLPIAGPMSSPTSTGRGWKQVYEGTTEDVEWMGMGVT